MDSLIIHWQYLEVSENQHADKGHIIRAIHLAIRRSNVLRLKALVERAVAHKTPLLDEVARAALDFLDVDVVINDTAPFLQVYF